MNYFQILILSFLPSEMEKPVEDPVQTMVVCKECNCIVEDLESCSECGKSLVVDLCNVADTQQIKPQFRKREITPLGMFLKEQKQNLKKSDSTRKLNLSNAMKSWRNLSQEEKLKYNELSLRDKEHVQSQKNISDVDVENVKKARKKVKNKNDADRKAIERKNIEIMKKDLESSKNLVNSMLIDKRKALLDLDKDLAECKERKQTLSRTVLVSDKLLEVKKEKLKVIKRDYKELFSRRNL